MKLSGFSLKMIALVTMLIDHFAAVFLFRYLESGFCPVRLWDQLELLYRICRIIGRMAFPIYCFLLVEGFIYTRSRAKYAGRLFLFALLSEIPFDLALKDTVLEFSYQNVFFTLFLGLITIWGLEIVQKRMREGLQESKGRLLIMLIAMAGALTAEFVLRTDYGAGGVMAILLFYLLRGRGQLIAFASAVVFLGVFLDPLEFWALLMLIPLALYNGTRGRQVKYIFYAFYPLHLLLLAIVCMRMGI